MYAHVCGCGDAASFASLQVCLPFFRLFLFFVCCFRMGPFLFPSLYARANIIMCLSFSSRVLRYKNMLCNTSVIQSITKKFQEIRIIFPSYVCWLSLKGLPLHPQSREMRHFRQCDWLGETNVGEFSLTAVCTQYLTLAGLRERERIRPGEDGRPAFYGSFEKKLFQKKLSKTFGGYDKISYLCIRFRKRWQNINESSLKDLR